MVVPDSQEILLEKVGVAPAPSRDYGQLLVTKDHITFRMWRITARVADAIKYHPKQWIDTYADFIGDEASQREIQRFFGTHTLREVKNFALGGNGLLWLPENAMLRIGACLNLLDIKRLGSVCRHLNKFANSDELWKSLFKRHSTGAIPEVLVKVAEKQGWKKVFFTNKLQLQVQMRKEQRHYRSDGRDAQSAPIFVTEVGDAGTDQSQTPSDISHLEPVPVAESEREKAPIETGRWSSLMMHHDIESDVGDARPSSAR